VPKLSHPGPPDRDTLEPSSTRRGIGLPLVREGAFARRSEGTLSWRRWLVVSGSSALLAALAFAPMGVSASADVGSVRPPGDPGGAILKELLTIKGAVPPRLPISGAYAAEPHLTDSCTSTTPDVQVDMSFTSRESLNRVAETVGARLRARGWSHYTRTGPGQWYDVIKGRQVLANNWIYRWQKVLPQGVRAGTTLQVGIPVTGWVMGKPLVWNLGSNAPGVGEPKRHCGEG
jgi:hypothetical protein